MQFENLEYLSVLDVAGRYDKGPTRDMCSPGMATADQIGYLTITHPAVDTNFFSQLDPAEEIPYFIFTMNFHFTNFPQIK